MIDQTQSLQNTDQPDAEEKARHDIDTLKKRIPVRDVMTPNCQTAGPDEDAATVAQEMVDTGVTCLVVVEKGKVVGLVTQMNLVSQLAQISGKMTGSRVRDCMSSPVIGVYPNQSIWEATEGGHHAHRHIQGGSE
jgi:predicted transcriptional regulator